MCVFLKTSRNKSIIKVIIRIISRIFSGIILRSRLPLSERIRPVNTPPKAADKTYRM